MKKIYIIILGFLLFGCDDFLDIEPKGLSIPDTVEEYDLMLNARPLYLGNSVFMDPDLEIMDASFPSRSINVQNAYSWAEHIYPSRIADGDWNALYAKIYVVNEIIENIDAAESTTSNEELRSIVKGQAYAERAHLYFWLVNFYSKHYNVATASTDPGVPLKLKNDLQHKLPRATVEEVYDLIESDLDIAMDLVPTESDFVIRADQASIDALHAKIALFKGEFSEAITYASSAITAHGANELYDYKNTDLSFWNIEFSNYDSNKEHLWAAMSSFSPFNSFGEPDFITTELDDLFTDKVNDLRYVTFLADLDFLGFPVAERRLNKSMSKIMTASLGELYLIRAECYARTDETVLALADLNFLRQHRFTGTTYQLSAANSAEALQHVKDERRRELIGHGLYLFDLKRYHTYGETVPGYTRIINGTTYTLEPGSNRYVMPIPEFVRNYNPNLEQNPR